MKITRITPWLLAIPLGRPVKTAVHDIRGVDPVIAVVETDTGLVGSGYAFAFGRPRARAILALVEDLVPLYDGQDPIAARALHARAWQSINFVGHAGVAVMALAALDTACWDVAAQAAGLPLFRYLGGDRRRIPTYASSGLWLDDSIDELLAEAERFLAAGQRAMKMRLGRSAKEDVERVWRVREALGPDVKLLADVNQGWDGPTASASRFSREMRGPDMAPQTPRRSERPGKPGTLLDFSDTLLL